MRTKEKILEEAQGEVQVTRLFCLGLEVALDLRDVLREINNRLRPKKVWADKPPPEVNT